jgi:type I restriction enzyme S subunit
MELAIENKFKQTDIGLIPSDWEVKLLKNVAQFENGKAHETFIDDNGDFVVVNSKFISSEGKESKHSSIAFSPLDFGDIVMVMSDIPNGKALAKCYFIEKDRKYTLNQRICSFKTETCDNHFLFRILNRNKYFLAFDSGTGQTNLKKQEVLDCPIPLPPTKAEQTAIATALSDADNYISSIENLIAKKQNIKQGAMQKLLAPKKDWVVKKLGEVFSISSASSKSRYITEGGKYVIMDMGSVSSDGSILKNKFTNNSDDLLSIGDLVMPKDDIGGGKIIGKVGYIDTKNSFVLGDHVYKLKCTSSFSNSLFFSYLINSAFVNRHFRMKASGSAQIGIGKSIVVNQEVIVPNNIEEQIHIATILSDMDAEIAALEKQLAKARNIKQGMMQNLLTGKIRLI